MRILGNIDLRLNDDSKSWTLLTPVEYYVGSPTSDVVITVPANERTDLASVPRYLRWLLSTWQGTARAAIVHDYLYRTGGEDGRFTKKQADRILAEVLEVVGEIGPVKRWAAHKAVVIFGRGNWPQKQPATEDGEPPAG